MFKPYSLKLPGGRLAEFNSPVVMGIVNVTPDSFYASSRAESTETAVAHALKMLEQGARILDIGGCSTRPGAAQPSADEELRRLIPTIAAVRKAAPDAIISVDTYRADVARAAVEAGADIINDVGGCTLDPQMADTVASLGVPYILMHPAESSLTSSTPLDQVTSLVLADMQRTLRQLRLKGVADVIIDPGFGFGKTMAQNYRLMTDLDAFHSLGAPLLVGISRKSMIYKPLNSDPKSSLNGTTVLNTYATLHGAAILRVHDVAPTIETIRLSALLTGNTI